VPHGPKGTTVADPDGTGPQDARATVLGRVRAALGPAPEVPDVPRTYRARGEHDPGADALLTLLDERLADYRATVHRVGPDRVAGAVGEVLADRGAGHVVVPPGLPDAWRPAPGGDLRVTADDGTLAPADLDAYDAVVTGCAVAVAETGTLVLDASPDQGRRALTLVPDRHVCVVPADRVVQTVPEALARLDPGRPLTMVSGPSATSDIELDRVEGVHGPRVLDVLLVAAG
jgi:L-lactate dehydrogenase complex protein LldG